jgi:hypothetical protein
MARRTAVQALPTGGSLTFPSNGVAMEAVFRQRTTPLIAGIDRWHEPRREYAS